MKGRPILRAIADPSAAALSLLLPLNIEVQYIHLFTSLVSLGVRGTVGSGLGNLRGSLLGEEMPWRFLFSHKGRPPVPLYVLHFLSE